MLEALGSVTNTKSKQINKLKSQKVKQILPSSLGTYGFGQRATCAQSQRPEMQIVYTDPMVRNAQSPPAASTA